MSNFEFEPVLWVSDAGQDPSILDLTLIEELVIVVGDYLIGVTVVFSSTLSTSSHFTRIWNIDTDLECGVQQLLRFGYCYFGSSIWVEKYHGIRGDVGISLIETSGEHGDSDTTYHGQQATTVFVR